MLGAVLGCLAGGCGGSTANRGGSAAAQFEIQVSADRTINKGRPLHVLVRAVDLNTYLQDSYATVAGMVVTPDDSVIGAGVIYPGHDSKLEVPVPDKGAVAVYFLFTQPDSSWKTFIEPPLPAATRMALGQGGITESSPVAEMSTAADPGMPRRRKIALISGGVGAAGLIAGTTFGLLAESRWDQTSQYCNENNECTDQTGIDLGNRAQTYGWIANVSFAIGVVGVAAGTALWLTTPSSAGKESTVGKEGTAGKDRPAAIIAPLIGPERAGMTVHMRF